MQDAGGERRIDTVCTVNVFDNGIIGREERMCEIVECDVVTVHHLTVLFHMLMHIVV